MTTSTYGRAPVKVTVSKKSQAISAPAWERRKLAQVVEVRSGAGPAPVPAQHRFGAHQQPDPAKHVPWEPVQQGSQERPVARAEPRPGLAQLPLQDRDLVTQHQRERARHTQISKSKQHSRSSCRSR
jgi:hypothetical protein